jgi:hypothetical protein
MTVTPTGSGLVPRSSTKSSGKRARVRHGLRSGSLLLAAVREVEPFGHYGQQQDKAQGVALAPVPP